MERATFKIYLSTQLMLSVRLNRFYVIRMIHSTIMMSCVSSLFLLVPAEETLVHVDSQNRNTSEPSDRFLLLAHTTAMSVAVDDWQNCSLWWFQWHFMWQKCCALSMRMPHLKVYLISCPTG